MSIIEQSFSETNEATLAEEGKGSHEDDSAFDEAVAFLSGDAKEYGVKDTESDDDDKPEEEKSNDDLSSSSNTDIETNEDETAATSSTGGAGSDEGDSTTGESDGDTTDWAAEYEKLQQKFNTLKGYNRTEIETRQQMEQRLADLQFQLEQASKTLPSKQDEAAAKLASGELKTPEDWEEFRKEYEDFAGPIESYIKSMIDNVRQNVDSTVSKHIQPIEGQLRTMEQQKFLDVVERHHSDWADVMRSDEFNDWQNNLPYLEAQTVERIKQSSNPYEVVQLFDTFKSSTGYGSNTKKLSKVDTNISSSSPATNSNAAANPNATRTVTEKEWQDLLSKVSAGQGVKTKKSYKDTSKNPNDKLSHLTDEELFDHFAKELTQG